MPEDLIGLGVVEGDQRWERMSLPIRVMIRIDGEMELSPIPPLEVRRAGLNLDGQEATAGGTIRSRSLRMHIDTEVTDILTTSHPSKARDRQLNRLYAELFGRVDFSLLTRCLGHASSRDKAAVVASAIAPV